MGCNTREENAADLAREEPRREFHVRILTDEGEEECFPFTDLDEAREKYATQLAEIHKENLEGILEQDIHIELLEVLEMEQIKTLNVENEEL